MSELRDSAVLVGLQLGGALTVTLPAVAWIGACAGWVPVLGTLAATFLLVLWWGKRRPGFLTRTRVRRLALHSGLAHAPMVGLSYAASYLIFPDMFAFPPHALALLAPTLGLAGGIVAMVLTLCAGDGAAAALGGEL